MGRAHAEVSSLERIDLRGEGGSVDPAHDFGGFVQGGGNGDFLHIEIVPHHREFAREFGHSPRARDRPEHTDQGPRVFLEGILHGGQVIEDTKERLKADHHHRALDGGDVMVLRFSSVGLEISQQAHRHERIVEHDGGDLATAGAVRVDAQRIELVHRAPQHGERLLGKASDVGLDRRQGGKQLAHGRTQRNSSGRIIGWRGPN